jgi:hypothetical protein
MLSDLVLTFLIALLIFLVLRSVMLWYWKVNVLIETQRAMLEELRRIGGRIAPMAEQTEPEPAKEEPRWKGGAGFIQLPR